ncbi:DUF4393 domain-containing protein [Algoriphagus sp.]|uniref:DUF4393 domain-containing protein n=1 Tax=Algoriphagus sp. TaxID=1872435 RepID=UPI00262146F4|nr:DUF4393 domain-containing protein [Algoriphagus sp.]
MIEEGKEIAKTIKDVPRILELIYKDLAQPSVKKVGKALGTVFELSNTILLPVKLMNEKVLLNYEKHMNSYKEKLNEIPEEEICEVPPEIGIPITEKLTYTTNDEIADLFTSLLTKASSEKTINQAHPSFVQLIERLSVDEGQIIRYLKGKAEIPCISQRLHQKDKKGYIEVKKRLTGIEVYLRLTFPRNIKTYLDNLESMGIISIDPSVHKMDNKLYEPLEMIYKSAMAQFEKEEMKGYFQKVEWKRGFYEITDFGRLFINACTFGKNKPK